MTAFAIVADNFHMLRQWSAQQRLEPEPGIDDGFDPFGPLPSAQPTAAAPPVIEEPKPFKEPKGLDAVGSIIWWF